MNNLIKAEFFKLRNSAFLKRLLAMYLIFEIVYTMQQISHSVNYPIYNPSYTGIEWFCQRPSVSFYLIAVYIFASFYVGGDFSDRTLGAGFLCGLPRRDMFWAKIIVFFVSSFLMVLVYTLTGTLFWTIHSGFGLDFSAAALALLARTSALYILHHLILVVHTFLFAVIAKSKIGAFILGFGVSYVLGVLCGNAPYIQIEVLSKILVFSFQFTYIDYFGPIVDEPLRAAITGTAAVAIMLPAAMYLFEKGDLK